MPGDDSSGTQSMNAVPQLSAVLDELIGEVGEVHEAQWIVGPGSPLRQAVEDLWEFLIGAADALAQCELQLGGDLRDLPSPSSRIRPRLSGNDRADVGGVLAKHLDQLADHVETQQRQLTDDVAVARLTELAAGLRMRAKAFAALGR